MATLSRVSVPGLEGVSISRAGIEEDHLTVCPLPEEPLASTFRRASEAVLESEAKVVKMDVLGALAEHPTGIRCLEEAFGVVEWPVTWVEGGSCGRSVIAGIQIQAVRRAAVETVLLSDRPAGRVFEDEEARYCILGNITPDDASADRGTQARQVLEKLETALGLAGMGITDVIRTWFHIDRILQWYPEFNVQRTRFFEEKGVFDALVPASTGIGAANPDSAALLAGAVALKPRSSAVSVRKVGSPMQCEATAYGSSFTRAVEVVSSDLRRVLVSGTASINRDGNTVHEGDVRGQIGLTLEVVSKMLAPLGMGLSDATRAVAYFKNRADADLLEDFIPRGGGNRLPLLTAHDEICRDDLLFELEVDAVTCL